MWAAESGEMASEGEVKHDNNNTVKVFENIAKTNKQTISTTTFRENNDNHNKLVKLNMQCKGDKSLCACSKQVTIHVVIVVLALLAFLGIGILLGYFIGKPEKHNGKLKISIVAKFTW